MGLRSTLDASDLLGSQPGKAGVIRYAPVWPLELWERWGPPPDGLIQQMPQSLIDEIASDNPLSPEAEALMDSLGRDERQKDYLKKVKTGKKKPGRPPKLPTPGPSRPGKKSDKSKLPMPS